MKRIQFLTIVISVLLLQACVTSSNTGKASAEKAAQYNAQLGINYMNKHGDLEQARIKLEKALEQDRSNALANAGYAQLQSTIGNKELAATHYKRAIENEPLNADHHNAYGVFLCEEGKIKQAIVEFDKAVENRYYKTPEYALDNAGICLLDDSQIKDAEEYLVKAVKANSAYTPALLNLADLNLRAKRNELASAYYKRFEKTGKATPRSLWVGYQVNRNQGNHDKARQISESLLRNFPNSRQAGELLTTTVND